MDDTGTHKPIVLMRIPDSPLGEEIALHLRDSGRTHRILSLDAPREGKPVTVSFERILWEGFDLSEAGIIWLECPLFPWPQPRPPSEECDSINAYRHEAARWREAQSLAVSAIATAAEKVRVINPPATAHLAVSPVMALDRLAREGFEVHPWILESVARNLPETLSIPDPTGPGGCDPVGKGIGDSAGHRNGDNAGMEIGDTAGHGIGDTAGREILDAAGRDRGHTPGRPGAGDPAIRIEPFVSAAATFLIVGGRSIGRLSHPTIPYGLPGPSGSRFDMPDAHSGGREDLSKGHDRRPEKQRPSPSSEASGLDTRPVYARRAVRAARTLGLDFAAVSVRIHETSPSILFCDAAPDLAAWNQWLEGGVSVAIADYLSAKANENLRGSLLE